MEKIKLLLLVALWVPVLVGVVISAPRISQNMGPLASIGLITGSVLGFSGSTAYVQHRLSKAANLKAIAGSFGYQLLESDLLGINVPLEYEFPVFYQTHSYTGENTINFSLSGSRASADLGVTYRFRQEPVDSAPQLLELRRLEIQQKLAEQGINPQATTVIQTPNVQVSGAQVQAK